MGKVSKDSKEEIRVNSSTFVGSVFSQFVGVTVTDNDVTLDFAYIHPRDGKEGQVVSRVTLPKNVARELSSIIVSTMKQHEDSKKN